MARQHRLPPEFHPFPEVIPPAPIEAIGADGLSVRILDEVSLEERFVTATDILAEIEDDARFGRFGRGIAATIYPAMEGLLDGIATWCTLQNMEDYRRRLPELHPNVNADRPTILRIAVQSGRMRDEMFGDDAPFPYVMGFTDIHKPYAYLIKPLMDSQAMALDERQAKALERHMLTLLDISYIARGSLPGHHLSLNGKNINRWSDIDEAAFLKTILPLTRTVATTIVAAVKKAQVPIPRSWLPKVSRDIPSAPDPIEAHAREIASTVQGGAGTAKDALVALLRELADSPEEREGLILDLIEGETDGDTPDL